MPAEEPHAGIEHAAPALDLVAYIKTLWSPYLRAHCQGAKHVQCMEHSS
ncbi:MAG: hypothetical protein M0015_12540 [Betaproteobacteria bacterium]|nr:hypothetical protein [Betaproteobacteria bacterium]